MRSNEDARARAPRKNDGAQQKRVRKRNFAWFNHVCVLYNLVFCTCLHRCCRARHSYTRHWCVCVVFGETSLICSCAKNDYMAPKTHGHTSNNKMNTTIKSEKNAMKMRDDAKIWLPHQLTEMRSNGTFSLAAATVVMATASAATTGATEAVASVASLFDATVTINENVCEIPLRKKQPKMRTQHEDGKEKRRGCDNGTWWRCQRPIHFLYVYLTLYLRKLIFHLYARCCARRSSYHFFFFFFIAIDFVRLLAARLFGHWNDT